MALTRPFRRTIRPGTDYPHYVTHPKFAEAPEHYVRAYLLLQKDLIELFDYIEPSQQNLPCHSFRVHELLMRACIEVEANCRAILKENGYARPGNWNRDDYRLLDGTHHLSGYTVRVPTWHGAGDIRRPFAAWAPGSTEKLEFYDAYNETKHDRRTSFEQATFERMLDAVCGAAVLLAAQFGTEDFAPSDILMSAGGGPADGMKSSIGGYFRIGYPKDWEEKHTYDFEWNILKHEADPFAQLFP